MSHGKYLGDALSDDDEGVIDITELPNEYRIKLNGFLRNACHDGHETLTRILLDKGADVNYVALGAELPTVLHVAVCYTKEKILPILVSQASDSTIQSALQYATQHQSKLVNIIHILQKDGTRIPSPKGKEPSEKSPKKEEATPQPEAETQTPTISHTDNESQTAPTPISPISPSSPPSTPPQTQDDTQIQQHLQQIKDLNTKLNEKEKQAKELEEKVREQEAQMQELRKQLEQLEKEKGEIASNFEEYRKKSEASTQENQEKIDKLEKDVESKVRKIEKLTKERDSERRAKEIAKRILSSNGPKIDEPENIGHSYAIRMGSSSIPPSPSASPVPNGEFPSFPAGEGNPSLSSSQEIDSPLLSLPSPRGGTSSASDGNGVKSGSGAAGKPGGETGRQTPTSPRGRAAPGARPWTPIGKTGTPDASPRVRRPGMEGRAKDDMDIASEAERARVRRLVKRWEEMKFL